MKPCAYYNEIDAEKAAWIRELIKAGVIAPGDIDERDIKLVQPEDLRGYRQCHFFAGIAGWSYALRLAGWEDNRAVWTGSCPCQSLSCAGQRKGHADKRHLWPAFYRLIAECKPSVVFGEQVASKDGREWLAGVRADLESAGYACGAADLCAASVGAPMVSQRLHWVAETKHGRHHGTERTATVANSDEPEDGILERDGWHDSGMAQADSGHGHWWSGPLQVGWNALTGEVERSGRRYRAQWRIKPGLSLLADGIPGRVAQLRGFGDAIVPQLAKAFIEAYCETRS